MAEVTSYRKIAIPLTNGGYFVLGSQTSGFDRDSDEKGWHELALNWRVWPSKDGLIEVIGNTIRLKETKNYCWAIDKQESDVAKVHSSLDDKRRQRWLVEHYKKAVERGSFCVINHLGYASFELLDEPENSLLLLKLEFVSAKIDFNTEYRQMTQDIAAFCEQLLLSASAPTSLKFSSNPTEQRKLLLESFLFLRHFLSPQKLQTLSEHIHRNPHSTLISERDWKPLALVKSNQHLSNPSTMLRDWRNQAGSATPAQGLYVRREESHDTPPNQFVKFALQHFRKITQDVLSLPKVGDTITRQAEELQQSIDSTLAQPFFRDITRLNHLPLNNQTLQKREGYRDFLRGWILVESASSLDWEGQRDCFEGETRDVATLYEYWLFLELHKLLSSIGGMRYLKGNPLAEGEQRFIQEGAGAISLHLKSGKNSLSSFTYQPINGSEALRIDLHYEKTFTQSDVATSGQSYSRQFRPDYTLSIFPARFADETEAAKHGKIAHLHFDAKYRVDSINTLFGEESETQTSDQEHRELTEEKQKAKVNSYKRGDLLKMHTYNDALRKTIGSYVLYPGNNEVPREEREFRKFHEIAPSVGAHIMKPGNADCSNSLKAFIIDVLKEQQSQFTQYSYLRDINHTIVKEAPNILRDDEASYEVAREKAPCLMIWMNPEKAKGFKQHGFAYCRAIPEDPTKDIDLNLSLEAGSEFIPIGGHSYKLQTLGWRAKTTSVRLISKEKLKRYIQTSHPSSSIEPTSDTKYYVLVEFSETSSFANVDVTQMHKSHRLGNSQYIAVSPSYQEILKCSSAV